MGVDVRRFLVCLVMILAVARGADAQDTSAVRSTAGGILVDFQDVDLRAVITALAEAGSLNVSYGDIPARKVTLRLHQPVSKADVLPLLRSLALANGLQVVQEDKLIRLQADDVRQSGAPAGRSSKDGTQAADMRLFVYHLKHARAAKIASTLQAIFGQLPQMGAGPGGGAGSTSAAPTMSNRSLSQQLTNNQVPPVASDGDKALAAAATASVAVNQTQGPSTSLPASLTGVVRIVPDETTNALVIHALPVDYEIIRQAIGALDLRPLQVVIEVLIAEVRHSSELDLGVAARSTREPDGKISNGPVVGNSSTADLILRMSKEATFDINVAVRALQSTGDVRILSRPVLLAQNNQEAKILVGSQRPFVQVFRSLPTDDALRDQVVQYKDVGTSLTILPTINDDGYVNLQIAQEVSSATTEVQFGAPVISTREAATHLFVRDGQTAVMGGLVDREQDRSRSAIPGLSLLPVLGFLFGSTTDTRSNTELFLFLTPHIVQSDEDVDRLRHDVEQQNPRLRDALPSNPPLPPKPPPAR
jgi:general secretion pathway protein D